MKSTKSKSSKWINETGLIEHRFEWQPGFGAFLYSQSQLKKVTAYIQQQEKHHQKQAFNDEYISFLNKFEIEYDQRYLFNDLI